MHNEIKISENSGMQDFKGLKDYSQLDIVVVMEANLLVTCDPTHAGKAKEEITELLEGFGGAEFLKSDFDGIFILHTKENPKKIVKSLHEACTNEPYKFKYTFRWIPIEKWSSSDMGDMARAVKEIDSKMDSNESWKMDLGKRGYEGDSMELLVKLTENINKPKVDLKNPQKIVKVEIVGNRAGFALLDKDEYLNVAKMKTV